MIKKKSDSPDDDTSIHDAKRLIPIPKNFFVTHPQIHPEVFLGDTAFDSDKSYKDLLSGDFGKDALVHEKYFLKYISL